MITVQELQFIKYICMKLLNQVKEMNDVLFLLITVRG